MRRPARTAVRRPAARVRQLAVAAVALGLGLSACTAASTGPATAPTCDHGDILILIAQSVPSATLVPCISEFPAGWTFGGEHIDAGQARFWLDSDRAGPSAVTVTLSPSCDTRGAIRIPVAPDESGTVRYERPDTLPPGYSAERFYRFPGGCVTYRFSFGPAATFTQALEATAALTFYPRDLGVRQLRRQGLTLCGAGVRCPG